MQITIGKEVDSETLKKVEELGDNELRVGVTNLMPFALAADIVQLSSNGSKGGKNKGSFVFKDGADAVIRFIEDVRHYAELNKYDKAAILDIAALKKAEPKKVGKAKMEA